ncbi:protein related with cellulose biosynthesis [Longilinea arvoryzae]|uniref:Protein related with cellulose biosynthesis n=1 Tax=Longilinea arvoryzae TaxID=360412 RepID=A0A0S7BDE0_9CHLR|nr:GNAT family N-acetyltransferase [Longilinea arvoryzae]GAP12467.1 protein related with cellulose biosynthesis [Longilinea arvoryzae]
MQFTLHTIFPEMLRSDWNALLEESVSHVPFLRYEYLYSWWQTRGGGEWPVDSDLVIVTATQDGRLAGIAPLFRANHAGRKALMLIGSIEVSDYLDFIVRPVDLDDFLAGLLPFLAQEVPDWQALDLYNLLDSSPSLTALQRAAAGQGWRFAAQQLEHSPYIPLPGDWETYLASIDKKQRHEIRRKMRRAEEAAVPIDWSITTDPAALETDMETFLALMSQDPEKETFLTPAMRQHMRNTMCCAFEEGCLQLAFLNIDGKRAAGYLNFHYIDRLWIYNSGLDRSFSEYSPGWVLLGDLLKWANENGIREFDFMRGDEEYKYRFGSVDRFVMRATLVREEIANEAVLKPDALCKAAGSGRG